MCVTTPTLPMTKPTKPPTNKAMMNLNGLESELRKVKSGLACMILKRGLNTVMRAFEVTNFISKYNITDG